MRVSSLFLVLVFASSAASDVYERQPAVDVTHYDIAIDLTDADNVVRGTTKVEVRLNAEIASMWLDFEDMTVDRLQVSGKEVPFTHDGARLTFGLDPGARQSRGTIISVDYHGTPSKSGILIGNNSRGHRVFFAENWPDNAHRWFPCIDHPHDKATADLAVTAPGHYRVVSNGRLVGMSPLPGGRIRTRWRETVPVPTYCMVFGAADFLLESAGKAAGVPLSYYFFPEDASAARAKFARSNRAVEFFSKLVGPYPYEKLAQVEATTRIGGMENASAIFYAEDSFKGESISESPVPHEVAHQWFGDSVTEADWDHLWLSEGFATYLDALFYESVDGHGALKTRLKKAADAITKLDQKRPGPVIDPLQTDPSAKLNAYNYEKGAWILHMLRGIVGDRAFFEGIRRYYRKYRDSSVMTGDFEKVMEAAGGMPLGEFFRQWLQQPGYPRYRATWKWSPELAQVEVTIRQEQTTGLFDMPLEIALRREGGRESRKVRVSADTETLQIPTPARPLSIEIDPEGWVLKSLVIEEKP